MGKYEPLARYLEGVRKDRVRLRFAEVEEILGFALPESARRHDAWWANSRTKAHSWALLWRKAGWQKVRYDFEEEWVEFERIKPQVVELLAMDSAKAREGYEQDRSILARARNPGLAQRRKELDDFTCQACRLRLQVHDTFVIEAHHLTPLSVSGEVQSDVEDLVSLCPTCHRIAHLREPPFEVEEIAEVRERARVLEGSDA